MVTLATDTPKVGHKHKACPLCGGDMSTRENSTTFWEKKKGSYSHHCSNTNCLHKIPLNQEEIDILKIEQSLLKWEIDLETIEQQLLDEYELSELLKSLRKTVRYLRSENGTLTAKEYFMQELKHPGGKKKHPWKWQKLAIPVALLLLTLGTITLLGPSIGTMMQANILTLLP